MKIRFLLVTLLLVLVFTGTVFAQGVQTAILEGTVTGPDGKALPGVSVSVKSPALMGERQAVTTTTGDYNIPGLPPGDYTVTFSLEGMQSTTKKMNLVLGLPSRMDAQMRVTTVAEAITVTAASPAVLENQTVGANIKSETVQQLPILRTPTDIGALSPGVTGDRGGRATTPVGGQLSINGGLAYDNNMLINGVNMQDNIFGNANNLFIEDAVQETQVLTSGISAEYGHFTGGVLNVITKSGGNTFTGSLRDDLSKPGWLGLTPFEQGFRGFDAITGKPVPNAAPAPHVGKLSNIYEATFGGPIVKDHLWFFAAGRKELSNTPNNFPVTGGAYTVSQGNKRPEGKLTATIGSGQTLQADYIDNPVTRNNEVQVTPLEMQAVGHNSVRVNHGYTANYSGVISSQLFAEARYSKKIFGFRGLGGTSTDIHDSPIRTSSTRFPGITIAGTYNAPYFDATDPEDRDNKQMFAALSYFLSKPGWGSHDIKGGYENFVDTRTGGNSQTASSYVFTAAYVQNGGVPVLDASGRLQPVFTPKAAGSSAETRISFWLPTRNAELDTTTKSFFINDRWNLNQFFTFNLGVRHENVDSKATGGLLPISSSSTSPRLGASFDVLGNGKYKVDVTYAQYAGRYNPALIGSTTPVGNPARLYGYYIGPAGQGRDFEPGFTPSNYKFYAAVVPTGNIFQDKGMHSPAANEVTLSGGMGLPKGGWLKATFTNRKYTDFIEDFITVAQGCTNISLQGVNVGCVDNSLYKNSNLPKRNYQSVDLQSHYDVTRNWGLEGNWTHQFKNNGNYEGESGQSIPTTVIGDRPEMQDPREFTTGRLAQFEADRARLWTTYQYGLGRFGNLSTGLLYRYDSPQTFTYNAAIPRSNQSKLANPGATQNPTTGAITGGAYHNAPTSVTIIFGDRGAGEFNSTSLFDASLQYSLPISRVTPWIKFDVRNVFNDHTLIAWNTAVSADPNSAKDSMGYATGFTKNSTFGRPTNANSYVRPREYLLYAGVRF